MTGNETYKIHAIPLCSVDDFPRASLHWLMPVPQDAKAVDGHFVWYIEGPREHYLVDAGAGTERFKARNFKTTHIQDVNEGLNKLGLETDDIDYIILTHAHYDHSANLPRFPKAKVIMQKAEKRQVEAPFPYLARRLPPDSDTFFRNARLELVEGDTRIDDNIQLVFTPGHTDGGQSISIKTAAGNVIITGFCSQQENFTPPAEFVKMGYPFTIGTSHSNPVQLYESTQKIIDLADVIIPSHEWNIKSLGDSFLIDDAAIKSAE